MHQKHNKNFLSYKEWANFSSKWNANPISVQEIWKKSGLTLAISFSFTNKDDEHVYISSLDYQRVWNF